MKGCGLSSKPYLAQHNLEIATLGGLVFDRDEDAESARGLTTRNYR